MIQGDEEFLRGESAGVQLSGAASVLKMVSVFVLRFSDWELIYKLLEQRELQLRLMLEADGHKGRASKKSVLKEYKQVCETLKRLTEPSGRSWSKDHLTYKTAQAGPKKSSSVQNDKVRAVDLKEIFARLSKFPDVNASPRRGPTGERQLALPNGVR